MTPRRVLVVDDEPSLRRVMQVSLEQAGYEVLIAPGVEPALALIRAQPVHLVVTDLRMDGASGIDLLRHLRQDFPDIIVILVTAFGTVENAVEAMKLGAYDFITKPVNLEELRLAVARALEHSALKQEVHELRRTVDAKYGFERIIGRSPALLRVLEAAARAAPTDSTILIQGQTGTGKELLARALHQNSRRKDAPFVTVNCGAIPRDLIESELFGHRKGSFTGAVADKIGRAEAAHTGTLFLDEIGDLSLDLQVKLLRLLQQREIDKIGDSAPTSIDVRVIAATHRDLKCMTTEGTFREDLYYRLSVIPLTLPPLRERLEDIPELVRAFFHQAAQRHGRPNLRLEPRLMQYFLSYAWPGNIRELENAIERVVVLAQSDQVQESDLPDFLRPAPPANGGFISLPPTGISLEQVEKDIIESALARFQGNQSQAARFLDITRKTLIYRMEKHGIRRDPAQAAAD